MPDNRTLKLRIFIGERRIPHFHGNNGRQKMTKPINKLLVLSSGGDAPGMNAAIRAVVRTAIYHGIEVYGSELGYCGLMKQKIHPLTQASVANCIQRGGTILKTARCVEFHNKSKRDQCRQFLNNQGIDGMIVLGGNGSFIGATLLEQEGGPKAIGIPCTIDNDIIGTEYCIGFDTACNTALEAIDKIRDTAYSLDRNFLIEVMGRASGFIAVDVGIAGGAEIILTPEFPITTEQLVAKIQKKRRKKMASIIVAAEADQPGYSMELAKEIKALSGLDYKVCILGHTQRGGTPTAKDRTTGSIMGARAVEALLDGQSQKMVAVKDGEIKIQPFPDPKHSTRFFDDKELLLLNEVICEI